MTEVEEFSDQGHMIKDRQGYSSFRGRCRDYNNTRGSYRIQDNYRDKVDNRQRVLEVNPNHQFGDLELHQGLTAEVNIISQWQTLWSFCQRMC